MIRRFLVQLVDALSDLLGRTDPGSEKDLRLRTGVVEAATSRRATVALADATLTEVPFLTSYTPGTGDVVLLLQNGSQLVILGRVHA
jgi:hypothetical protein